MEIPAQQKIKLESMQVKGIRWMIWNNINNDDIESHIFQIIEQSSTNDLTKLINHQSRANLIKLIERSSEITTSIIDTAYEKYRYGLKPGFTLFWVKSNRLIAISKEQLSDKIQEYFSKLQYDEDGKYKKLEYCSIIEFDGIYEISLSYLQRFNYINSDGEFTYVYMMKECFIWVGIDKNFIAINNIPESLMTPLKNFFSKLYSADITNIKITNGLLNKVFSVDNAKRVTKHSSNPPENQLEKITMADPKLSEKLNCMPTGYENYDVTNTQYVEEIDDSTTGTLGVNCNKGKLYLSKSLTSTQFRSWSTRRITDIIGYFQNSTDVTIETISGFNMFTSSLWDDIKKSDAAILNEIVYAILFCKRSNVESCPVSFNIYKAYTSLNKYFIENILLNCDACEETAVPYCYKCGHSQFSITKKSPVKIICTNCGDTQAADISFNCEFGHTTTIKDINEILELVSNDDFCEKIFSTIKLYYPDIKFLKNEYISLSSTGLEIHHSPDYEKLKPSDIFSFSDICNHTLTRTSEELDEIYKTFKEKCTYPTKEKCLKCKENTCESKEKIGCLLKLFDDFEGFVPQPHQGHEFGDVSMLIEYQGKNMSFQGVAKSIPTTKKGAKITRSSDLGREIIEQVLSAFHDNRVDITGVIYPYLIDEQLKYFLYYYAKLSNKRLVILERDFMIKLLDYYLDKRGF